MGTCGGRRRRPFRAPNPSRDPRCNAEPTNWRARSGVSQDTRSPSLFAQIIERVSMIIMEFMKGSTHMGKEDINRSVVGRWFTEFWGKTANIAVIDAIAAPNMLLKYSLHAPRRGRAEIKAFMTKFRTAFPDLNFWGTADLIAEGDYVVGQWEGGGTHTGPAFDDFLVGSLPAATGRKMHFTGTTVLKVIDGKIVEEIGLDDGVTALTQLGLITTVTATGDA